MPRLPALELYRSLLRYSATFKYTWKQILNDRVRAEYQKNRLVSEEKAELLVEWGKSILEKKKIV